MAARGAVAGVVAGGVSLAVGELVAGIGQSRRAPVIAVGELVIDVAPRPVKDFAIDAFGTNDKLALLIGIYSILAVVAAALGVAATRRFTIGATGIGAFAAVGVFAALQGADAEVVGALASVVGAIAGIAVLRLLLAPDSVDESDVEDRRRFLRLGAGAVATAGVVAVLGRALQSRVSAASSRLGVVLPAARPALPALPASTELGIEGLSPFVTPNSDFYRIDVSLIVPQVPADTWSLTVTGRVGRELRLTYDELLDQPMVEADVTLACVSNEVGDDLVGNARWLGTPLLPLLERAGIDASADQVVARAVDGFTVGFPVDALRDGRTALVAVGMNGEPLPIRHGFPARLVVAGLYGYVSATKWVDELELTRFDDFDAYWITRGWAVEAPIKTQSRIDTPRRSQRLAAGTVPIAGVAWAPTRGIEKVEVQVDGGPWAEARLADVPGNDTWRQWVVRWDAEPGDHTIRCRATDGDGETQTEQRVPPFPDGATGWHTVAVTVD